MRIYRPYRNRTPDFQYRRTLRNIMREGTYTRNKFQKRGTYTVATLPIMVFPVANGVPLITERKCSFWRKPISEIFAFINGARTLEQLRQYGDEKSWANWWGDWVTEEKCKPFGLQAGDLGPGSYGAAFHDFPMPDGSTFNQWEHMIKEIRDHPWLRTHRISTWIPYYALQHKGLQRKVAVAPCHGDIQVTILGRNMYFRMDQRSCDVPVGLVANMVQWFAAFLALAQVTGFRPHTYIHAIHDGQIYTDQVNHVKRVIRRRPRPFPTLRITDPKIDDFFAFRPHHFELTDYDPHPAMNDIPVTI